MRSILLHVDEDDCMEAWLQAALDLAWHLDARLECEGPPSRRAIGTGRRGG